VGRVGADPQLIDHPRQPGGLAGRQVEHQASHGGGVDDRVLERPLETPAHEIGVESVVTVLDQDGAAGEAEEGRARIGERADLDDQERAVARSLDVKRDVVRILQPRVRRHRIPFDDQLLEQDGHSVARLQAYG
jgi:hypothetical protein